jgi:hypothetical protein
VAGVWKEGNLSEQEKRERIWRGSIVAECVGMSRVSKVGIRNDKSENVLEFEGRRSIVSTYFEGY